MKGTAKSKSSKKTKAPSQGVVERLLLAKALLAPIRHTPEGKPDGLRLAQHVLLAHDAAELALAAIAEHAGKTPSEALKGHAYLPHYVAALDGLDGKDFFKQLNQVRKAVKHQGILPSTQQWYRVGERIYAYISDCCQVYLGIQLDGIDECALIADEDVRTLLRDARKLATAGIYKGTLALLALAEYRLYRTQPGLRGLTVGVAKAEDALKLVSYGVPASDYLRLQEFLPRIEPKPDGVIDCLWDQAEFGHPANWRRETWEFCMATLLALVIRVQRAEAPPLPVPFSVVYEHKITAKADGVEIWTREGEWYQPVGARGPKKVLKVLAKGDSLIGHVSRPHAPPFARLLPEYQEPEGFLHFANLDMGIVGYVAEEDAKVTCVPKDDELVRARFPDLPEIPFE